ncbi:MAG TPA: NAD+ synthase [Roseiflexaceae bacterium]|nr:NAD+ synthase [Roseiflexaceae bacterium]
MQINIAIAQFKPSKGMIEANLERLGTIFSQLDTLDPRPDVLVLPETALSGYFLEGGVRDAARSAGDLALALDATYRTACGQEAAELDLIVGFYERFRNHYYNSALYVTVGGAAADPASRIRHVHRKVFLPTYGVFDEARFVEAGRQIAAFDTRFGRMAILICEDAWHSASGMLAALDGAQIVFVVSASPARGTSGPLPDNVAHWQDLIHRIADEHGVYATLAQLVGFEGGKGFPGGSFIMGPRGDIRVSAPLWHEALITATIDPADLPLARADQPLLADLETMLPHVQSELDRTRRGEAALVRWEAPAAPVVAPAIVSRSRPAVADALEHIAAARFDPDADLLALDGELTRRWLVEFLRDEVTRRRGFRHVVVALSGGVDSALTTFLCAEAFGAEHVLAIRMPYRTSSRDSLDHAQLVIDQLGIRSTTVDISDAVDAYTRLDPEIDGRRRGNIMARMRMIVLFDHSQKLGTIPIGTGNKTERLFGYYTWHADDSPPVNPLGDLFKTQVWQLARHVGVPDVIIEKPASADLIVGQTDEADFGISYVRADRILAFLLHGYAPAQLERLGFGADEIQLVKRRVDSTHWKRRLPSTAMLSTTAIGEFYLRPVDY